MTPFTKRVIDLALSIPEGRVTTYGALAKAAGGDAVASRTVTGILASYPDQEAIPWHRIVYANGRVWIPHGEEAERRARYAREDIVVDEKGSIENFTEIFYDFSE